MKSSLHSNSQVESGSNPIVKVVDEQIILEPESEQFSALEVPAVHNSRLGSRSSQISVPANFFSVGEGAFGNVQISPGNRKY